MTSSDGSPQRIDRPAANFAGPEAGAGQETVSARSAAIVAAIGGLGATLHASSLYNAKLPQDVRKVAANILIKVIDLIMELYPKNPEWVITLDQLLYGLKDLDRGKPNVLFEPVKLDNRPPNTIADVIFRAIPAAAMTCLMRKDGIKRAEAAETIARKLRKLGYKDRSGAAIKTAQIAQWREEAMARRPKEQLAARRYRDALNEVKGMTPEEAVTYLLASLPNLPPPHFPQNPLS
ncbi:MAG: hypothetical protein WAK55_06595 [Xanthobacteraceae bacterium]